MCLLKMLSTRLVYYVCNDSANTKRYVEKRAKKKQKGATTAQSPFLIHSCYLSSLRQFLQWRKGQKLKPFPFLFCILVVNLPLTRPQGYVSFENAIHYKTRLPVCIEQLVGTCLNLLAISCCDMKAGKQGRGWNRPLVDTQLFTIQRQRLVKSKEDLLGSLITSCRAACGAYTTNQPIRSCLSWD